MATTSLTPNIVRPANAGTISGFTTIDLSGSGTVEDIQQSGFSIAEVLARLQQLVNTLSPDEASNIQSLVYGHISDHHNPHRVKLADLVVDITTNMFGTYMPGTVPLADPIYALNAEIIPPLDLSVVRNADQPYINERGQIATVPANTVARDFTYGYPTFCIQPNRVQLAENPTITATYAVGCSISIAANATCIPVDPDTPTLTQCVGDTTNGLHGIQLPVSCTIGNEYVTTLFFYPLVDHGYMKIYRTSTATDSFVVDLTTGDVVQSTGSITPYVIKMVNGWFQIALQYVATTATDAVRFLMLTDPLVESYIGTPTLWGYMSRYHHTSGSGLPPPFKLTTPAATLGNVLTHTFSPEERPIPNRGMFHITFHVYPSLLSNATYTVFRMGNAMQAILNKNQLTVSVTGSSGAASYMYTVPNDQDVSMVIAWDAGTVLMLYQGKTKAVIATNLTIPVINDIVFGPAPGYIVQATIYPTNDDKKTSEFLIGEDNE